MLKSSLYITVITFCPISLGSLVSKVLFQADKVDQKFHVRLRVSYSEDGDRERGYLEKL